MTSSAIVQKLWNYCNVLRDDGMSYGDYVEQLTYLLFLKMADERTKSPYLPVGLSERVDYFLDLRIKCYIMCDEDRLYRL